MDQLAVNESQRKIARSEHKNILRRRESGEQLKVLASDYGVSITTIRRIILRQQLQFTKERRAKFTWTWK